MCVCVRLCFFLVCACVCVCLDAAHMQPIKRVRWYLEREIEAQNGKGFLNLLYLSPQSRVHRKHSAMDQSVELSSSGVPDGWLMTQRSSPVYGHTKAQL